MSEPDVQMLWESCDPHLALRQRFGLADGAAAARWVAAVLAAQYGILVQGCDRLIMSDRNALAWVATDRGPLVVKWCIDPARFERLAGLARLTRRLSERGLPVSAPLLSLDGRPQVEVDGVSVGVQRVIDGEMLDVHDVGAVYRAGVDLARLHSSLADDGLVGEAPGLRSTPLPLHRQISEWFDTPRPHLGDRAVATLRHLVSTAPSDGLPVQVVHGDYRSANVLCRDGRVVAILDFEEAHLNHAVVDLARSAVLLGTRFHDWGPVAMQTHDRLRRGYESVRPLSDDEAAWWTPLVLWWTLMFVPAGDDLTGWRRSADNIVGATSAALNQ